MAKLDSIHTKEIKALIPELLERCQHLDEACNYAKMPSDRQAAALELVAIRDAIAECCGIPKRMLRKMQDKQHETSKIMQQNITLTHKVEALEEELYG